MTEINFKMTAKQRDAMKKRNAKFNSLPKWRQRVQIARDVIAALGAKEIVAQSTYFSWDAPYYYDSDKSCQLAHALNQTECRVCGIGSLFVAAVKRADKITILDFLGGHARHIETKYLSKWFDRTTLDHIEDRFEVGNSKSRWANYTPTTRMIKIMKNIIAHKGKFVPEELR